MDVKKWEEHVNEYDGHGNEYGKIDAAISAVRSLMWHRQGDFKEPGEFVGLDCLLESIQGKCNQLEDQGKSNELLILDAEEYSRINRMRVAYLTEKDKALEAARERRWKKQPQAA